MKVSIRKVAVFTLVASMVAGSLIAAPFEELFQIKNISGKCYVKVANTSRFVKAELNKAYPYGTSVKTDKKGSATIFFSKDNTCILKANTIVILSEEKNKNNKIITLDKGNIDVNLDKEFHKSNGLKVVTATGTCKAIGCVFSVAQISKKDKKSTTYTCTKGKIGVSGDDFEAPRLDDQDVLAVTTTKDNTFTRIELVKNDVKIIIKNAQGKAAEKKFAEGSVIKIWRHASESGKDKIVTLLITDPEGALKEAITYTVPLAAKAVLPTAPAVAIPEIAKTEPEPTPEPPVEIPPKEDLLVPEPIIGHSDPFVKKPHVPNPPPTPTPTPTGER